MVRDIVGKVLEVGERGLMKCAKMLNGQPLRIGTMCSGTESPILTLNMITKGNLSCTQLRLIIC